MKQVRFTLFLLLAAISFNSYADSLTTSADRNKMASDETLQLKIRYDEQVIFGDLDLSPLTHDFKILSNRRQQQFSKINGKTVSYTDWNLILQPKSTGSLVIPALEFKGTTSNTLTIAVAAPNKTPNSGKQGEPVFVESEISADSVFVQQQVVLTYRLYMAIPLQNISMNEMKIVDSEIHQIDSKNYQKSFGGITYSVIEVSFALFPQSSGELEIPPTRFNGYATASRHYNESFFPSLRGNSKRFDVAGERQLIEVKPKPANSGQQWLPAQQLSIEEKWSGDLTQWQVGEPITRNIRLTGVGVTASQLPAINMLESDKYRVYPDQPELNEEARANGIISQRDESIAFVPSVAGNIELPAVTVDWWDTNSNTLRTVTLAGRTVEVKPATNQAYSPKMPDSVAAPSLNSATSESTTENSRWLIISLAFNALLVLLVLRLAMRKTIDSHSTKTPEPAKKSFEKELFNAIRASARDKQPQQFQKNILLWARCRWPNVQINTLEDVAELLADRHLTQQLAQLSAGLYSNNSQSVELLDIANEIKRLRTNGFGMDANTAKNHSLQPLYPS